MQQGTTDSYGLSQATYTYSLPSIENLTIVAFPPSSIVVQVRALYQESTGIQPSWILRWSNPYSKLYTRAKKLTAAHVTQRFSTLQEATSHFGSGLLVSENDQYLTKVGYQHLSQLLNAVTPIFAGTELKFPQFTDLPPLKQGLSTHQVNALAPILSFAGSWHNALQDPITHEHVTDSIMRNVLGSEHYNHWLKLIA
jgi:hypothetical protein